ncbi:MAG: caffeoyl-CoA O-methyltransferase, partial [Flavobacteriales bacterium]
MNFIQPEIEAYALQCTSDESELLNKINRDTHINVLQPRMLSGAFQGRLLSMLSHMVNP